MTPQYQSMDYSRARTEVLNAFMRGVYGWMGLGLGVTALAAFMTASTPAMMQFIFGNQIVFFGLIIAELVLVVAISAAINKLSASAASGLFLLYSALNGLTLSVIFMAYTQSSIMSAFVVSAGMFAAMSVYGLVTKKDLTSWGSFLFMGLIGIIIASIVNMFVKSSAMSMVISYVGVLVFVGLTAYDTQKLKIMGETAPAGDGTAVRRGTILGALTLYLDFINLFLMMLRIMGSGRE